MRPLTLLTAIAVALALSHGHSLLQVASISAADPLTTSTHHLDTSQQCLSTGMNPSGSASCDGQLPPMSKNPVYHEPANVAPPPGRRPQLPDEPCLVGDQQSTAAAAPAPVPQQQAQPVPQQHVQDPQGNHVRGDPPQGQPQG